jgi:predicted aspartyl protease
MIRHLLAIAFIAITIQISAQVKCLEGDCKNGHGILETADYYYDGTFSDGKRVKGKLTDKATGDIQDGTFFEGNLVSGKLVLSNGTILQGKFIDGKLSGEDCMLISDGSTLTGQFLYGKFISGRVEDQAGNMQEGSFKNGLLHGKNCTMKLADKTTFKGEYIDGNIVKGKITYSPNDDERVSYEGSFAEKDGAVLPHGIGTMVLKNGNKLGPNWVYGDFLPSGDLKAEIPSGKFAIDLSKNGGVYELVGVITNGQHVLSKDFILDTGASLVVLPWSTVVELKNQNIITSSDFYEGSISLTTANGDKMEGKKFKIKQINFEFKSSDGKPQIISLKNIEAVVNSSESERRKSIYGLSNAPTLLGQSALEQFKKFELDFEQNLLIINEK